MGKDIKSDRDRWGNRFGFIMASVGAAIGFGNVWRFPSLAYKYGGGAFFIPYLMALFFIGIPILIMEIALGQYYQAGDSGVFISMHKRLGGTGLASISCGYFITLYYVPLITWVIHAFFDTFGDYAWDGSQIEFKNGTGIPNSNETHFNNTLRETFDGTGYFVLNIIGAATVEDGMATKLVPANVGYLFLTWACIYGCVAFGVKIEGYITYFTMGFPIVLLFVFLGITASLDGAEDGIKAYIGVWDMSVLSDQPECWSEAVSQIFFSIGVTLGIMTAFGSHCDRNAPALVNSVAIALGNSFFSFIAGFMVFSAVGSLAHTKDVDISEIKSATFSLVFGTVPQVLDSLSGGKHLVRLFFLFLFLLGIDSAFALTEAVVTVVKDTTYCENVPRWQVAGGVCLFGYLAGLLYVTDAGLNYLDVVDHYVNFILILVGFFECYAVGWAFDIEKQIEDYGALAVIGMNVGTFLSVFVASLFWFGAKSMGGGFAALLLIYSITMWPVIVHIDNRDKIYGLYFGNITKLVDTLSPVVGPFPLIVVIFIKHIISPILLILFVNLSSSGKFGKYGGYDFYPYQALGIGCIIYAMLLFLIGVFVPSFYKGFKAADNIEDIQAKDGVEANIQAKEGVIEA